MDRMGGGHPTTADGIAVNPILRCDCSVTVLLPWFLLDFPGGSYLGQITDRLLCGLLPLDRQRKYRFAAQHTWRQTTACRTFFMVIQL